MPLAPDSVNGCVFFDIGSSVFDESSGMWFDVVWWHGATVAHVAISRYPKSIDAFAAEKRRLDRIAEREMRESVAEKLRQKAAYNAQTQGILDWQQAKIDEKRRAMEADDARRAELKRIRDEHDAVLNQAAKEDFQARIDHARAQAEDRMYGRIRNILDKEDRRAERPVSYTHLTLPTKA